MMAQKSDEVRKKRETCLFSASPTQKNYEDMSDLSDYYRRIIEGGEQNIIYRKIEAVECLLIQF